jgi:hypothetical protein
MKYVFFLQYCLNARARTGFFETGLNVEFVVFPMTFRSRTFQCLSTSLRGSATELNGSWLDLVAFDANIFWFLF